MISFTWLISPQDERKTVSSRDEINQCRKLPLCFWSATIKTSHNLNKNVVIKIRTYKVLNLPSTTTRSTHTGKSVHYKMGVLAVN